jgi:hypothetical protein
MQTWEELLVSVEEGESLWLTGRRVVVVSLLGIVLIATHAELEVGLWALCCETTAGGWGETAAGLWGVLVDW